MWLNVFWKNKITNRKNKTFQRELQNKLDDFYNAMNWGKFCFSRIIKREKR